jgi:hypothetical protein
MTINRSKAAGALTPLCAVGFSLLAGCGGAAPPEPPAPEEDEVSVGYGTQSPEHVTGSVASPASTF